MKKTLLRALLLMAIPSVLVLQSCKDEEEKNTASVPAGSATISGTVTADVVLNNGNKKDGLAGYLVTATITTGDLVTYPSATYPQKTYSAVTDANGNYSITIETGVKPVNVTISYPEFFYGTQVSENNVNRRVRYTDVTIPAGFVLSGTNYTTVLAKQLSNGNNLTLDIHYANYVAIAANVGLAKVTGTAFFRNDVCKGASPTLDSTVNTVPAGTTLIVTWNDPETGPRELEVKTDANGNFEFNIETSGGQPIQIAGRKFSTGRNEMQGGNCVTVNAYEYELTPINLTVNKGETTTFVSAKALPINGQIIRFQ